MSTAPSMVEPAHIGRPRKLTDIHDFQAEIDAYFAGRDVAAKPYTMHGLARHLDCSRQTILNYEQYNDASAFVDAIKRARERVAEWTEDRLHQKGYHPAGAIFSLKNNFGWKDVQEIQVERSVVMGVTVSIEQHRHELETVDAEIRRIAGITPVNADRPALSIDVIDVPPEALSPQPETTIALSPAPKIPVSDAKPKAKATPKRGVSPRSVA